MTTADKLLGKMDLNPLDWRIEQLKTIAKANNVAWRQPGTSHVTFRHSCGAKITVPAHKPIKPVYIRKFVRLIRDGIGD